MCKALITVTYSLTGLKVSHVTPPWSYFTTVLTRRPQGTLRKHLQSCRGECSTQQHTYWIGKSPLGSLLYKVPPITFYFIGTFQGRLFPLQCDKNMQHESFLKIARAISLSNLSVFGEKRFLCLDCLLRTKQSNSVHVTLLFVNWRMQESTLPFKRCLRTPPLAIRAAIL